MEKNASYYGTHYKEYPKAVPPYPKSTYIVDVKMDKYRYHKGEGDMWPLTWGNDDNIYAAAGDNRESPLNFWKIQGEPSLAHLNETCLTSNQMMCMMDLVHNLPCDPNFYLKDLPNIHRSMGLKPAGLLDISGVLFMAVEAINYGHLSDFMRQMNTHGFIMTSRDYGLTWDRTVTPVDFFTGRLASCHFLQFGKGYRDARDHYVYAYFPAANDGCSYWENGDYMLLGRVPCDSEYYSPLRDPYAILNREKWEFYTGMSQGEPVWDKDDRLATPVFTYEKMCGENHVSYNKGIGRYLLGNYSFVDDELRPCPNHQGIWPQHAVRSQLSLYEAPEPWGPWSLFYQDDNWGTYGNYQPSFPTKWMYHNGRTLFMVSSGTFDDYNFTYQRMDLKLAGDL